MKLSRPLPFTRRRFLMLFPALFVLLARPKTTALWSPVERKPAGGDPQINEALRLFSSAAGDEAASLDFRCPPRSPRPSCQASLV